MQPEHLPYLQFTTKSRLDKSINSLLGIVEGISIDGLITEKEISYLKDWIRENNSFRTKHPFNELVPVIEEALSDGVLTEEEVADISWLCEKFRSGEYYDLITTDLQRLHFILGGIVSDGEISVQELDGLSNWLEDHSHLKSCWPYDEIDSLVTSVMADRLINDNEHAMLKDLFCEFVVTQGDKTLKSAPVKTQSSLTGLCAVCPEIQFENSKFCFTGASNRLSRREFQEVVIKRGGVFTTSISGQIDYLVIGSDGNPCWSYACYGRKVEKAVELRKTGSRIQLVHESDFHDAL